jgi:hypothetical protein
LLTALAVDHSMPEDCTNGAVVSFEECCVETGLLGRLQWAPGLDPSGRMFCGAGVASVDAAIRQTLSHAATGDIRDRI